ncbi:MAG: hypothetical protein OHK0045_20490 [Raineya sp.]
MENFDSFEEERKHFGKLPKEAQWLHKAKEEKTWGLDEPSILFASSVMSKIKAKEEKPVFHKSVTALFGLVWLCILGLAIWKSLESTTKWQIPDLDFSKMSSVFYFEVNSSIMMFSYLLLVFWGLFLINRFLQGNNTKQNTSIGRMSEK